MKAGRKLDALIAEKVMGKKPVESYGEFYFDFCSHERIPGYSTDISAAFRIVDRLVLTEKYYVDFHLTEDHNSSSACVADDSFSDSLWYCTFCLGEGNVGASADTPAHAICL